MGAFGHQTIANAEDEARSSGLLHRLIRVLARSGERARAEVHLARWSGGSLPAAAFAARVICWPGVIGGRFGGPLR